MIGRYRHPRNPARQLFVPLRYERGIWRPLLDKHGGYERAFEAAQACARDLAARYMDVAHGTRVARGLTEHPSFEFAHEDFDTDTVRREVQRVEELARAEVENVEHLLHPPDREHRIRWGGILMRVGAGGLLEFTEPVDTSSFFDEAEDKGESGEQESAEERFLHILEAGLAVVAEETGEPLSVQGVADAIARLRAIHPEVTI